MEKLKELAWLTLREWVILGMLIAGILAYFFPNIGKKDGPLHVEIVNPILIALTFVCIGLPLSVHALKDSLLNIKSHLLIQGTIFIMFPIFTYGVTGFLYHFIGGESYFPYPVALGVIITGSLPTTFDTGVIYAKICEADEALAVLNGTLSNLLGMILTPLLLFIQLDSAISSITSVKNVLIKLIEICLAPFVVSQLTHLILHHYKLITPHVKTFFSYLSIVPKLVLIWLTFTTMCETFLTKFSLSAPALVITLCLLLFMHCFMAFFVVGYLACLMKSGVHFSRKERVSHIFLGSQKVMTLAIPIGMSYDISSYHSHRFLYFMTYDHYVSFLLLTNLLVNILYSTYPLVGVLMIPIIAFHTIFVITDGIALPFIKSWILSDPDIQTTEVLNKELIDESEPAFYIRAHSHKPSTSLSDMENDSQKYIDFSVSS